MDALVTTEWLAKHRDEPDVRVVDGTWHMPQLGRDARAEFLAAHIPGAVFFDIDAIADHTTTLPHMLPSAEAFATAVGALGLGSWDRIIVYDVRGVVSAARVWWTFCAFGHDAVAVLDGGLRTWRLEGRPVEAGEPKPTPRTFAARPRPELVRDLAAVRANLTSRPGPGGHAHRTVRRPSWPTPSTSSSATSTASRTRRPTRPRSPSASPGCWASS